MAELVDAPGLGPGGNSVQVQVLSPIPAQIADLKALLNKNIEKCFDELNKINEFINSINDSLIRQIIIYRFIYGFSWNKVAHTIGGGNNAECLRKKMYRYLKYH